MRITVLSKDLRVAQDFLTPRKDTTHVWMADDDRTLTIGYADTWITIPCQGRLPLGLRTWPGLPRSQFVRIEDEVWIDGGSRRPFPSSPTDHNFSPPTTSAPILVCEPAAVAKMLPMASKDQTRYALQSVQLEGGYAIATTGYALGTMPITGTVTATILPNIARGMARISESGELRTDDTSQWFKSGPFVMRAPSALDGASFPVVSHYLAALHAPWIPAVIIDADTVRAFARRNRDSVVDLSVRGTELTLSVKNGETMDLVSVGKLRTSDCGDTGPFSARFMSDNLTEVLRWIGRGSVELGASDAFPGLPLYLFRSTSNTRQALLCGSP